MTNDSSQILAELATELTKHGWLDLVEQLPTSGADDPMRVAFVGPHNAGKSSLIAALTGDLTIRRSGKPETSDTRRYKWRDDIELVDLPGWFSGFAEHDDVANDDLRRNADLVAFVLTVELGDGAVVDAIEHVLGTLGFADRTVVVVNKSLSEDSDPAVIREEVDRRLGRHAAVPVFATDARSFLKTISGEIPSDDHESIQTLRESSGIDELSGALSEMVTHHGMAARVVAQCRQGARVADEGISRLVPDEIERSDTDRLDELESAIRDAQDRLDRLASAHLSQMESDISAIANRVLSESSLSDADHELAWEEACKPSIILGDGATQVLADLAAAHGGIVVAFDPGVGAAAPTKDNPTDSRSATGQRALGARVLGAMGVDSKWVADAVAEIGKKVAQEGAGKESIAYELARKIQPKKVFKPYERLKDAAKIQKSAKWLGKANFALPAVVEVRGWWKEGSELRAAERSKKEVQQQYADVARSEVERVRAEFDDWRLEALAPYEEKLRAGRAPLEAAAAEREASRQTVAALRDRLLDRLAATSSEE